MKIAALISTIAALIVLAAYIGRMSRPMVCINSSLVERLDIVTDTLTKSLQRCDDNWPTEKLSLEEQKWLKKIDSASSDFQSFSRTALLSLKNSVLVKVHLDKPLLWSVSEN